MSQTYNGVDLANPFDCDTVGGAGVWINPASAQIPAPVAAAPVPEVEEPDVVVAPVTAEAAMSKDASIVDINTDEAPEEGGKFVHEHLADLGLLQPASSSEPV